MERAERHTFQILTKRPELMRAWFEGPGAQWSERPLENVWLGTSIENDRWVRRADELRAAPAAVRFISAEPLLGPLPSLDLSGIDWLIVGGESGPHHRPMDEAWVRELKTMAETAGAAFFFKQWGGKTRGGSEIHIRSRGEAVVPVDQAAEQVLSANVSWAHSNRSLVFRHRCRKSESAMGPAAVVVGGVRRERPIEMPSTLDKRPVEALRPDGFDHPLRVGVGVGGPDGSQDHLGPLRAEDFVEGSDELGVPIADEEPDGGRAII